MVQPSLTLFDTYLTKSTVNSYVRVRLTEFGRTILYKQHEELVEFVFSRNPNAEPIPFKIDEDKEGWSRWQLWLLMAKFGPYMSRVTPLPFANDIQLEV